MNSSRIATTTTAQVEWKTRSRKASTIHLLVPRLPPELFRPIIAHIFDVPALLTLCLSSHLLRHEAEPLLYHSPTSSSAMGDPVTHDAKVSLHIKLLSTITSPKNERLASLVRVYHSDGVVHYRERPLWPLLVQGLQRMTGLRELAFRCFMAHPSAEVLDGCTFHLRALRWGNHSDERVLARILARPNFSSLKRLSLLWTNAEVRLGSEACPGFEELVSNRTGVEAILPGRKVEKLTWIPTLEDVALGGRTLRVSEISELGDALGRLRVLSFGGYFARPNLSCVVGWLRNVEVLELVGVDDNEIELLPQMPNLRELILSFRWSSDRTLIRPEDRPSFISSLLEQCPKLELVDLADEWSGVKEIVYERYKRATTNGDRRTSGEPRRWQGPLLLGIDEVRGKFRRM